MLEFDPPDLETLRSETTPEELGFDAGERGVPAPYAPDDPQETRICQPIIALGQRARSRLQHYLEELEDRRGKLGGTSPSQDLNRALKDAEVEFRQIAQTRAPSLRDARLQAERRKRELLDFKSANRLRRAAEYPDSGKKVLFGGIVAALFFIESFANTSFLAVGNELGLVGAYTVAFVISLLNLAPAFFWFGPLSRGFSHVDGGQRLRAGIATAFYLFLAFVLNLGVAHYREVSGDLVGNAGAAVVERLRDAPFSLQDAESWLLFGMGFLFSVAAFFDGRKFDDAYPGYGEVDRRHAKAVSTYDEQVEEVTDELNEVRQRALDGFKRLVHDAKRQPLEERSLVHQRRTAERNYAAYLDQLDGMAAALVAEYRKANLQARTDGETPTAHRAPPRSPLTDLRAAVGGPDDEAAAESDFAGRLEEEYGRATDRVHQAHEAALSELLGRPPASAGVEAEPAPAAPAAPALPAPEVTLKLPGR